MSKKSAHFSAVKNVVAGFPRRRFTHLPTPLQRLETLSKQLDINLWLKRDDLTGLAIGGNKGRKLEFVIADALAQGAQSIITWGGVQSNWCCQLAAASRQCGIQPILVLFKRPGLPSEVEGNVLLETIYGAEVHRIDLGGRSMMEFESIRDPIDEILEREHTAGRKCYVAPIGASMTGGSMVRPLGAVGFLNAAAELLEQAETQGLAVDALVYATGSGSMQAGLIAGSKLLRPQSRNIGISVGDSRTEMAAAVETIAWQLLEAMPRELRQAASFRPDDVIVFDEYMGGGYGLLNPDTVSTLQTMAACEGVMLDPVYTGKAFTGLLDLVRQGRIRRRETVVFLHTGGIPGLFAYRQTILNNLNNLDNLDNLTPQL